MRASQRIVWISSLAVSATLLAALLGGDLFDGSDGGIPAPTSPPPSGATSGPAPPQTGSSGATTETARLNAYVSGFADDAALEEAALEVGWEVERLRRRLQQSSSDSPAAQ